MAKSTQSKLDRDKDMPVFKAGIKEGRRQAYAEILTALETQFMNPELDISTPEGTAIKTVAASIGELARARQK